MGDITTREKVAALYGVALYRPRLSAGIISLNILGAFFEGISLGLLIPILEQARAGDTTAVRAQGAINAFAAVYDFINVPFTLEFTILGVVVVMTARFGVSFSASWLSAALRADYVRELQYRAFKNVLDADVQYFDRTGSHEILNAIVTRAPQASSMIGWLITIVNQGILAITYLTVATYLAPYLTLISVVVFGALIFMLRRVVEPAYTTGDRVVEAHEDIQASVQAGTIGIREVKIFGLSNEMLERFQNAVDQFVNSMTAFGWNQALMSSLYQFTTVMGLLGLIFVALIFSPLALSSLGVFLFALYRLAPQIRNLNDMFYQVEGTLPHFIRTQQFVAQIEQNTEVNVGTQRIPQALNSFSFDNVYFSYNDDLVLRGVTFSINEEEFIAFVGPSGAGKSTIVSLFARMYEPDHGQITANNISIDHFDLDEWRSRIAMVRQDPYIFNGTLLYNITIGNREATSEAISRVCDIAQVSEFLNELPDGLATELGDDGVRLSGGQRQRVAIARALLKDSDLLIFDEATSNLDTKLEKEVHTRIKAMDRDQTILIVAHRLSTIIDADKIHVMEDGQISDRGDHTELLANAGLYAELYAAQS